MDDESISRTNYFVKHASCIILYMYTSTHETNLLEVSRQKGSSVHYIYIYIFVNCKLPVLASSAYGQQLTLATYIENSIIYVQILYSKTVELSPLVFLRLTMTYQRSQTLDRSLH